MRESDEEFTLTDEYEDMQERRRVSEWSPLSSPRSLTAVQRDFSPHPVQTNDQTDDTHSAPEDLSIPQNEDPPKKVYIRAKRLTKQQEKDRVKARRALSKANKALLAQEHHSNVHPDLQAHQVKLEETMESDTLKRGRDTRRSREISPAVQEEEGSRHSARTRSARQSLGNMESRSATESPERDVRKRRKM